jgi:hypothetical protein
MSHHSADAARPGRRGDRIERTLLRRVCRFVARVGSAGTRRLLQCRFGLVPLFGIGTRGPSIMGFEDEAEQSIGRPCRQTNGRSQPKSSAIHKLPADYPIYRGKTGRNLLSLSFTGFDAVDGRRPHMT